MYERLTKVHDDGRETVEVRDLTEVDPPTVDSRPRFHGTVYSHEEQTWIDGSYLWCSKVTAVAWEVEPWYLEKVS